MKTTVKTINGSHGLTATLKRHLIAVVESGNKKYFGVRLKVNRTKMMVEELGENKYKVTEFVKQINLLAEGFYETELVNEVQLITK